MQTKTYFGVPQSSKEEKAEYLFRGHFEGPRNKSLFAQHTNSSRLMQLGGSTRRKTTAGGAHLLEAGSLAGFAHGDRTNSRPKCKEALVVLIDISQY